jgi:hypothetical protein
LRPSQISPREREILLEIEERLSEVQKLELREIVAEEFKPHRHALSEHRRQRVLLLDGGRGTGKTSFLLTLMNRWNHAAGDERAEEWEFEKEAPKSVRVIRNLDFDPLPPSMPLLAAIVHAWRPLAEYYDMESFGNIDVCDDDSRRHLMDDWHTLFRVAAAGWSEIPRSKGLIEEVLDREEQVRDWQFFRDHWVWFVDRLISSGKCLKKDRDRLAERPAFVVVIDDVDLQVERVRELLPALRLLAHDNVFFLVAADLDHLTAMLTLEFFGQQQRLANTQRGDLTAAYASDWARELARASVEKVFPLRNRWRIEPLTLAQLLRYPGDELVSAECSESRTIHGVLDRITTDVSRRSYRGADKSGPTKAGDAVALLADAAEKALVRLNAGSYRSVQQLWQTVSELLDGGDTPSRKEPAELLARLVTVAAGSPVAILPGDDHKYTVQVTTGGELAALYLPGPTDPGGVDDIVVSARADFAYIPADDKIPITFMSTGQSSFNFTAGLIAKTLQELTFPVDASTLTWNAHLTMAWTAWHGAGVNASFAWPWHTHPRPDELLKRTAQWGKYLNKIGGIAEQENIREKHAYAWVFYEREAYFQRLSKNPPPAPNPMSLADARDFPWDKLLSFVREDESAEGAKEWTTRTLPLLLRPEIGLTPDTQKKLLPYIAIGDERVLQDLRDQRRRLATNAIVVASLRRGRRQPEPSGGDIERLLGRVEEHHRKVYNLPSSVWHEYIEPNAEGSPA